MEPIKPEEVNELKKKLIPEVVIETVNELIAKNYRGKSAFIKQKDIVSALLEKGLTSVEVYDNNYLDFEDIYRAAGWKVEYDKPAYNESYDASFTFTVK